MDLLLCTCVFFAVDPRIPPPPVLVHGRHKGNDCWGDISSLRLIRGLRIRIIPWGIMSRRWGRRGIRMWRRRFCYMSIISHVRHFRQRYVQEYRYFTVVCCVSAVLLESTEALSTMMDSYISLF